MHCRIAIPTFNRAHLIGRAVRSALAQSQPSLEVMVIDDGSTDATCEALAEFRCDPRFIHVQLAQNVGTAMAKNVAIALGHYDAITFHDSDDIAERDKLLRQSAILGLPNVNADSVLNWSMAANQPAGEPMEIGVVMTEHWLLAADGSRRRITRALSIVDDFFPQLQMAAGPLGDWILVNPALFRRSALARVGGFESCVEEDRELRNRLLMHGEVFWLIDEPLLTKIECSDSLTVAAATSYASDRRARDRAMVWQRASAWRQGGAPQRVPIDLSGVTVAAISGGAPMTIAGDLHILAAPQMP